MVSLQNTEFTTEPEGAGCVCVPAHPSTAFRNYANAWAEAIPLLAEEGWREAPGWSVRPKPFANLTTPSAPIKEASRYFLKVASTPPLRGGEYDRSSFLAELDNTDRIDGPVRRRKGQAAVGHQFSQEGGRLGTRNGGLNARSNKTIGIIDGLPGVAGVDGHHGIGVAAASVPRFQFGAVIDEELNYFVSTLQCCAH